MSDVMAEFYDGPHATPKAAESGPVYLGIKNITDDGFLDLSNVRHIADSDWPKWTKRVTPTAGDVVFTYEATLHRYALIPEGFVGCLGRRIALVRPDQTKVVPKFLHQYMLGPEWRATVESRVISGATVDRIPLNTFKDFPIWLPPIAHQQRVVEVLGAIEELIENNRRRIEVLEEMAQAIYREWFVHFRFPGHESTAFKDTPLGPIPEAWELGDLGTIATNTRSSATPSLFEAECFAHFSLPAFDDGLRPALEYGDQIRSGKFEIVEPCVLLSKLNPRIPRVWLLQELPALRSICSTEFLVLTARDWASLAYLYLVVSDRDFMDSVQGLTGGTSGSHQRAKPSDVMKLPLVVPIPEIHDEFTGKVGPMLRLVAVLRAQTDGLAEMRDRLLPKLVTGEIDVSELDSDELVDATS